MARQLPPRSVQIYRSFQPFTIYAHKGGPGASHYPGGYFKHRFGAGGRIVGRPDGTIVLHPRRRRGRLWGLYPVVRRRRRIVSQKEPFLNPILAVLNPRDGNRSLAKRRRRGRQDAREIHGRGLTRREHMARRHYRRNPLGLPSFGGAKGDVMDAGAIAAGLIGVPMLLGMLPLPAALSQGWARFLVRGVGAYGAGKLVGMLLGSKVGHHVTVGALAGIVLEGVQEVRGAVSAPAALSAGYDQPTPLYLPNSYGEGALSAYSGYGGSVGSYTGAGVAY